MSFQQRRVVFIFKQSNRYFANSKPEKSKINKLIDSLGKKYQHSYLPWNVKKTILEKSENRQHPYLWNNDKVIQWIKSKESLAYLCLSDLFRSYSVTGDVLFKLDQASHSEFLKGLIPDENDKSLFLRELRALKFRFKDVIISNYVDIKAPKVWFYSWQVMLFHICASNLMNLAFGKFLIIDSSLRIVLSFLGVLLSVRGLFLINKTLVQLITYRQPLNPKTGKVKVRFLITDGVFAKSRNPMYTGISLCALSYAFVTNNSFSLMLVPLCVLMMRNGIILKEEEFLEKVFGNVFLDYKKRVPRWIRFKEIINLTPLK